MPSRAKLRPLAAPLSSLLGAPAPTAPAVPAARNRNSNSTNTNIVPRLAGAGRAYSSRNAGGEEAPASSAPEPPSRWYSDLHARLGKCLMFGCTPAQVATASSVLGALAAEWRPLVAGSQGYLTGGRRGLEDQQVVWGEQDSFQHVNNVTYVRYAESSRVNWVLNFAHHVDPTNREAWAELMTPKSTGLILKNIQVDFKFPLTYPDRISVYHKLAYPPDSAAGPSSSTDPLRLEAIVLSHRHKRVAARVWEEVVVYDYQAASKTRVLPFMRHVLAATYDLQARELLRARARVRELTCAVARLEKETWDRPDAVEDLGSAPGGKVSQ